jgi:two-component system LytT family response regulator
MWLFSPLRATAWPVASILSGKCAVSVKLTKVDHSGDMKTLIVDDEPIARRVLREELECFPEVVVVGEAENGMQALQRISEFQPDLVFLDLQMPLMGGFEVVQKLSGEHMPVIVIVTAFDEHAIQGFEAGAIDYLLKPVSEGRLQKAVKRAWELKNKPLDVANYLARIAAAATPSSTVGARKIVGRAGADYVLLDAGEILAFQAEGELVWIVTSKQRLLATQNLRSIEDRLKDQNFRRVHRNAIVNMDHVRKMSAMSSQRWLITLSNALQVVVSKRQAHSVRKILHW